MTKEPLERGRRGVRVTPAGRALARHARTVEEQIERLRGELGDYARGVRGRVRLLANTAATSELLPEALGAFLTACPNVDVALEERQSQAIVQAVAGGEADVGVVADTVGLGELETFPLRVDRLVLVTGREHPLGARRRVGFAEALEEPFVRLGEGSALEEHLGGHAAGIGKRPAYRVRGRSFEAICRMVARGVGVAVIPETAARRCQRTTAIRRVPLAEAWALRRLTVGVRRFAELPAHARRLVEALRAGAPGLPRGARAGG